MYEPLNTLSHLIWKAFELRRSFMGCKYVELPQSMLSWGILILMGSCGKKKVKGYIIIQLYYFGLDCYRYIHAENLICKDLSSIYLQIFSFFHISFSFDKIWRDLGRFGEIKDDLMKFDEDLLKRFDGIWRDLYLKYQRYKKIFRLHKHFRRILEIV